jgi:two-component system chemotaxis response regulator CheB
VSQVDIVAIGCSTGGPTALVRLLPKLRTLIDTPILITQHGAGVFTDGLANQISRISNSITLVSKDLDEIKSGHIYIAPKGHHLTVVRAPTSVVCRLDAGAAENHFKPSVDPMLRSVAKAYGRRALAVILTGMGKDGLEGCKSIVSHGGRVLVQDESTSAVWGMPGAVAQAGLAAGKIPLPLMAEAIQRLHRTR